MTLLNIRRARGWAPDAPDRALARLADGRAVWVIAALQGAWLAWTYERGWFLQADLSNMTEANGRNPDWGYLSAELGGHFSPITRFVYWVMNEISPLDYSLGVALRVAVQAAATVVLFRLLRMLVGPRSLVTVIVALYAFNPLLLAGTAMFTPGITVQIGQLLVLVALVQWVRYESDRRLRHAAWAGVLLALAILSSEQWIVAAAAFPLLSVIHLYRGAFLHRLLVLRGRWRGLLCLLVPYVAVGALAAAYADPVGAAAPSLTASYRLLRDSWLKTIGPSWVGGPFAWTGTATNYLPFAAPSDLVVIVGQLGVAVTVLIGVQRYGRRSLLGWLIPLVCWVASMLLVGYRGFASYQLLVAITPRYFSALIVLFAIGAAIALAPADPEPNDPVVEPDADRPTTADAAARVSDGGDRLAAVTAVGVVVAVLVASTVSGARYAAAFGRQHAETYVDNLRTSARLSGGTVNIYDTAVPGWLISGVEPHHMVSDLLRLAGIRSTDARPGSEPLIASASGQLVRAVFVPAGRVQPRPGGCGSAVHGAGRFTFPLTKVVPNAAWWLRLVLFQSHPSTVTVQLVDRTGAVTTPLGGGTVHLAQLEALSLRLPTFAAAAVRITSTGDTSLCLTSIAVGAPFPASR